MAVNGVEIFLNVYFRVLISETQYENSYERVLGDLKGKVGLETKIKAWPELVFGKSIDFNSGIGQRFIELKNRRNKLTHFSSSHESLELPGLVINGLANTSIYDSLTKATVMVTIEIAELFI